MKCLEYLEMRELGSSVSQCVQARHRLLDGRYPISVVLGIYKKPVVDKTVNPINSFTTSPCSKYHQGLSVLKEKYWF